MYRDRSNLHRDLYACVEVQGLYCERFLWDMPKFESERVRSIHRYRKAKIDCLRFVMCPLLAQLEIGFFSSFSAAAVYSTNEANKAGLKQSIIFRCLWFDL